MRIAVLAAAGVLLVASIANADRGDRYNRGDDHDYRSSRSSSYDRGSSYDRRSYHDRGSRYERDRSSFSFSFGFSNVGGRDYYDVGVGYRSGPVYRPTRTYRYESVFVQPRPIYVAPAPIYIEPAPVVVYESPRVYCPPPVVRYEYVVPSRSYSYSNCSPRTYSYLRIRYRD